MKTLNKCRVAAMAILGTALAFTTASADSTVLDFETRTLTTDQYLWQEVTQNPGESLDSIQFNFTVFEEGFDPNSLCFLVFSGNVTYAFGAPAPPGENAIYMTLTFPYGDWSSDDDGEYAVSAELPPGVIFGNYTVAVQYTGDQPITLEGSFQANSTPIPAPAGIALLGLAGLAGARRRDRRQ
jgi:MYXO-CTERM domain-containing protein